MKAVRRFVSRLSGSLLGRADDRRVREELAQHLEMLTDDYVRSGLPLEEARRKARLTLGRADGLVEAARDEQRVRGLENLASDVRSAFRSVRRYPIAAGVAILSLATGIGATAVTLTVRDILFYKFPALYHEPQRLSRVQVDRADRPIRPAGSPVPVGLYNAWIATTAVDLGASVSRGTRDVRVGDRRQTVPVRAVTPNLFALVGVTPVVGRGFEPADAGASVLLSYQIWQQLFDGRADVVGQPLWIDNQSFTVAGVMPSRFWIAEMSSPVWTSLDTRMVAADEMLEVIVRRPPGVSPEGLDALLRPVLEDFGRQQPEDDRMAKMRISGLEGSPVGQQLSIVLPYLLAAVVVLTLLIACANVAVLMFAQWTARDREIAIRASIGASRSRIVQLLLTESMIIAVSAGTLGVCVVLGLRALILRGGDGQDFHEVSIDPVIFVKVALVTILAGLLTGIMPALFETARLHVNPLRAIRGSDRVRQRLRHGLVVFEISVTVALLVVAASMIDGYRRARRADLGFDTASLLTARVERVEGVRSDDVLRVVSQLPGVATAAASTAVPFGMSGARVKVSGSADASTPAIEVEQAAIRGPFFDALGVPIVAGRGFAANDVASSRLVVVNEALARRILSGSAAPGRTIWIANVPHDVIGVARDYASNPFRVAADEPRVFVPLGDRASERQLQLVVRAAGDPAPLVQVLRKQINDDVAGTAVTGAHTFAQIIRIMGQEMLVGTAPLVPLISIGAMLTMAGIYGVLAFAVSRRARELAVRMALGAGPRDLVWTVTRKTLTLVATGAVIGIGTTFALSRVVRAGGGAGSIYDPALPSFVLPIAAIVVIGLIATFLPARRAASIDPVELLRGD